MEHNDAIDLPRLQWYPGRIQKQGSRPLNFKVARFFLSPALVKCLPFVSQFSRETNGRRGRSIAISPIMAYNSHRKRCYRVNGQPQTYLGEKIPPKLQLGSGGFSYAFNATIQIVTMNTNAKKLYSSIGIAPSQGLRLTAYRIDSTCSDYITSTGFWAVFFCGVTVHSSPCPR